MAGRARPRLRRSHATRRRRSWRLAGRASCSSPGRARRRRRGRPHRSRRSAPGLAPARRPGRGQRASPSCPRTSPQVARRRRLRVPSCSERWSVDHGRAPARSGLTHVRRRRLGAHGRRLRQGRHRAAGVARPVASCCRPPRSRRCATASVPKGDALAVARIAGIQAAKRTPELIPLAHPIAVHGVEVDLDGRRRRRRHRGDGAHRRPHRRRDGGAHRGRGRRRSR